MLSPPGQSSRPSHPYLPTPSTDHCLALNITTSHHLTASVVRWPPCPSLAGMVSPDGRSDHVTSWLSPQGVWWYHTKTQALSLAFRSFGIQSSLTLQPPLAPFPPTPSTLQAHWSPGSSLCFSMPLCFCTSCCLHLQPPSSFFSGKTPAHGSRPSSNVTFCVKPPSATLAERLSCAAPQHTPYSNQHAALTFISMTPAPPAENTFHTKIQYPHPHVHWMQKFPKHYFPLLTAMHTNILYYSLFCFTF